MSNGSGLRNRLIFSGYTPDQLNTIDAILEDSFFSERDYEYADNLRIARVNVPEEVKEYEFIKDHGCCGFYDRVITHPDGDLMIGFNYGH
jgi:hypothetical protein